jgi:hypothetical protein
MDISVLYFTSRVQFPSLKIYIKVNCVITLALWLRPHFITHFFTLKVSCNFKILINLSTHLKLAFFDLALLVCLFFTFKLKYG